MMVRKLSYLICFIFVAMLLMPANTLAVTLVDNFQSYSTGLIETIATPPWLVSMSKTVPPGLPSVSAIADSGNGSKYLSYGVPLALPADETYGVSRALPTPVTIADTATLFLRFNADPANANNSFGLTTAVTPGAANFNDFQLQLACRSGAFYVRNGGGFNTGTAYTANKWYDVWAVIHPNGGVGNKGNFDVYMKLEDGTGATLANQIIAGALYRNASANPLSFFDGLVQGAAGTPTLNLTIKLDDIYLTQGENLSIPEPATMVLLGLGSLALLKRRKS